MVQHALTASLPLLLRNCSNVPITKTTTTKYFHYICLSFMLPTFYVESLNSSVRNLTVRHCWDFYLNAIQAPKKDSFWILFLGCNAVIMIRNSQEVNESDTYLWQNSSVCVADKLTTEHLVGSGKAEYSSMLCFTPTSRWETGSLLQWYLFQTPLKLTCGAFSTV